MTERPDTEPMSRECNYGNQEMPWDRWFGTFHDGSEDVTRTTRARKKRLQARM